MVTCLPGGPYYQEPGALGAFDGMFHAGTPPVVTIRKEDAAEVLPRAGSPARVVLRAPMERREGANVVGYLPGKRPGPIVVAGHHDGWMGGAAFDDLTGVASTLGLARALVEADVRPRHTIAFVTHTAEEYGIAGSRFDWCVGAWWQIVEEHREWASRAPFYLNVEMSGHAGRLEPDAPPELAAWTRRHLPPRGAGRAAPARVDGSGRRARSPRCGPSSPPACPRSTSRASPTNYKLTAYHTQYDTIDRVDFDYLTSSSGCTPASSSRPTPIPTGSSTTRRGRVHLRRAGFDRRLERLERMRGRAAFTALGRGLSGLDVHASEAYPHVQPAQDVAGLEAGLAALRAGKRALAARRLAGVGLNAACADLSEEAFAREHARYGARAPGATWAAQGDPEVGPNLWRELASLRGEPGARAPGPWIERSVARHLVRARRGLERAQRRMDAALDGKVRTLPRAPA